MTIDDTDVMHQGKTIAQWEKDFKGEFTYDQLLKMAKGGCDLQKLLMMGLDENDVSNLEFTMDDDFVKETDVELSEQSKSPVIEFVTYDENGNETNHTILDNSDVTTVSLEYLSNCVDDMNDAAKACGLGQMAMILVDGNPLSNISSVRKAQLRRVIDMLDEGSLNESERPTYMVHAKISGKDRGFAVSAKDEDEAKELVKDAIARRYKDKDAKVYKTMKLKPGKVNEVPLDESQLNESGQFVTIKDLKDAFKDGKDNEKIMFKVDDAAYDIESIEAKNGVYVISLVKTVLNENEQIKEEDLHDHYLTAADLKRIGTKAYPYNKDAWLQEIIVGIIDGRVVDFTHVEHVKPNVPSPGIFYIMDGKSSSFKALDKEREVIMNEGFNNSRTGGYGGYGRSYRSYGEVGAPRGKAISWFAVSDLDPKARGKMNDWRVGPSNFPFKDLLYPNRKYRVGTTVLRSKFLKAGDESGVKYIAVPSYLDAIRNNDEAAIGLLNALSIPLDLTFGYGPNEDFSSTYTVV